MQHTTKQVSRIDDILYTVTSQSENGEYIVNKINGEWSCTCPDSTYRQIPCKHIHAVNFSLCIRAEVTGKKPMTFITDGLASYHDAYKKEFWTKKKETRTEHVRHIKLRGDMHNNKMERRNGEILDREKTMRCLKKTDTAT